MSKIQDQNCQRICKKQSNLCHKKCILQQKEFDQVQIGQNSTMANTAIKKVRNNIDTEIIIINDGSTDNTKKIIDDTKDEWDRVQLLLNYVDTYIEDDYLTNPLSVYDILEKKTGDCSEHALLFNTLARAAGIPSRELTGLMNYEDNKFGLHAWNEVVIEGYWYPVDPT